MSFRGIVGGFCLFAGAYLLAINSFILFRGAAIWGNDAHDQLAFGAAAAIFPWIIAVISALIRATMVSTFFGLKRPSGDTLIVTVAWVVFIAYNLTIATGSIAQSREERVAVKEHERDVAGDLRRSRDSKIAERKGLPQHRPAGTIEAEITAEKFKGAYKNSQSCREPTTRDQRELCGRLAKLDGELVVARQADALSAAIEAFDSQIRDAKPAVAAAADAQGVLLHEFTGVAAARIRLWQAASTPIAIEIAVALMWYIGFGLLGLRITKPEEPQSEPQAATVPVALLSTPEAMKSAPAASLEALTAQRKLAEWFFKNCARPVAGGALAEDEWYDHYSAICRKSNDQPLPVDTFRRIAANHVTSIQAVDGVTRYYGWLPVIPEQAA